MYVSPCHFLLSRLGWLLSSMMTETALMLLHWVLFLWWPWWRPWLGLCRRWCPLTHLVTSARQPFYMHVAHFVLSPLLINISSLFTHPPLQLHVWLSWKKDAFLWSIWFLFRFFSLKILWIWPWSNYGSKLGRYVFIYSPIIWALWNLSTLELWSMALQVNSTWSIVHHGPFLFIGLCQPWQEDAPCLNMIHKLYLLFYPDTALLHRLVL